MIQIGERKLHTNRPADIDAQVIEITGCSPAEIQRQLQGDPAGPRGTPVAHHVARVLHPFLSDPDAPDVHELTTMIAAAGASEVAAKVAALYAGLPSAAEVDHEGE